MREQEKQKSQRNSFFSETAESIKRKFIDPIPQERKTAPVNTAGNSFYSTFCAAKQEKSAFYDRKMELEPVNSLQEFANGGSPMPFTEGGRTVNVSEFLRSREKLSFLKKVYNFTKQKANKFKDMKSTDFSEQNLLAMVYYVENKSSMNMAERKAMRKNLDFTD